jgi:hypothetical protein
VIRSALDAGTFILEPGDAFRGWNPQLEPNELLWCRGYADAVTFKLYKRGISRYAEVTIFEQLFRDAVNPAEVLRFSVANMRRKVLTS